MSTVRDSRELERDLLAGVGPADDEDPALGQVVGAPVRGAVDLGQLGIELVGDRRRERDLERAGRDDDLVGPDRTGRRLGDVAAVVARSASDRRVQSHRQIELARVGLKEIGDVVLAWVAIPGRPGKACPAGCCTGPR